MWPWPHHNEGYLLKIDILFFATHWVLDIVLPQIDKCAFRPTKVSCMDGYDLCDDKYPHHQAAKVMICFCI